jgi:hypothetical protein
MCGREGGAGELRGERDGRGGLGGWGVSRTDAGSRQYKYENNVRRVVRAREGSVPNGYREKKEQQLWGELSRTPTLVSKKFSGSSILCSIVDMMTCATR